MISFLQGSTRCREHQTRVGMDMFISVTLIVYLGMAKAKIDRGVTEHLGRLYA